MSVILTFLSGQCQDDFKCIILILLMSIFITCNSYEMQVTNMFVGLVHMTEGILFEQLLTSHNFATFPG